MRIFVGILLAPELLDIGIASINFETSSEVPEVRNIEFRLGLCKYSEALSVKLDLIVSSKRQNMAC